MPIGMFTLRGGMGGIGMSVRTSNTKVRIVNGGRRALAFARADSHLVFFGLGASAGAKGTAVRLATGKGKRGAGRAVRVRIHGPGPIIALHRDR